MTAHLLDANVLIALTVAEHEHHDRAQSWLATAGRFAVCPVVEGALVRFLVRLGESAVAAQEVVRAIRAVPACDFWPDAVSYAQVDLTGVRGHRQVTDAYLVGLATDRAGTLATLDVALAAAHPNGTLLVPPV